MARSISLALWFAGAVASFGQTAVEAGLGASRAATSTAPAKGIGKSISGLAGSLDKALKPAQQASQETDAAATVAATKATVSASAPAAPAKKYEDPGGIEAGTGYDELVRRFGPPAMAMTFDGEQSLSYPGKSGTYQITVRGGKVKSVEKPRP